MSIGARIRLFRCARGWSLEELARQINEIIGQRSITKQALSKYEADKMFPAPKILNALGKIFGVKGVALLDETMTQVETISYRGKNSITQRKEESIKAQIQLRMEIGLRLQFAFGNGAILSSRLRKLAASSLLTAEETADQLRHNWNLGIDPISNMTDLLESHFIHVLLLPSDSCVFEGFSSWVTQGEDKKKLAAAVAVRTGISICRHRFTLAHELGHLLLNCNFSSDRNIDEETYCNRFAGAFLIPSVTLKEDIGNKLRTITFDELFILKQRYLVSIQCLVHRLLDLNLISKTHYYDWRSRIKKEGWEKLEPGDEIRNEVATLAALWIKRGLNDGIINKAESRTYMGEKSEIEDVFVKLCPKTLNRKETDEMNAYYSSQENLEWERILS